MGLQIPPGLDDEVPISGIEWRGRAEMSGAVTRDSDKQGNADLCGVY